jgi:hypothetical protein
VAHAALGPLRRTPVAHLTLASVRDGTVRSIPFQVDERSRGHGFVYTGGPEAGQDDLPGRLDGDDHVVFMACDLGEQAARGALPAAAGAVEIEVRDPADGRRGWAYLLTHSTLPATDARYVTYDPATDTVVTARYAVGFTDTFPTRLAFGTSEGTLGPNVLDRMKLRVAATLHAGVATWRMTEADVQNRLLAYTVGPVRVVRRTSHRVDVGLGLRVSAGTARTSFYAARAEAPGSLKLPFSPGLFFRSIVGRAGPDFRGLRGWRVMTPAHPAGIEVTGRPTEATRALDEHTRWFLLAGPGHAVLFVLTLSDGLARVIDPTFYLIDDATKDEAPEAARGQVPGVGYRLAGGERMPTGRHRFSMRIFDLDDHRPGDVERLVATLDRPLVTRVTLLDGAATASGTTAAPGSEGGRERPPARGQ